MGICTTMVVMTLEAGFGGQGVLPDVFYYHKEREKLEVFVDFYKNKEPEKVIEPLKALEAMDKQEELFCAARRVPEGSQDIKDLSDVLIIYRAACAPYWFDPNHYPNITDLQKKTCEKVKSLS